MTTLASKPFIAIPAALAISALNLSFLATPAEAKSVAVDVSAYSAETSEGRAAIETMVKRAARQVCGDPATYRDLARNQAVTRCVADARARAMSGLESQPVRYALAN